VSVDIVFDLGDALVKIITKKYAENLGGEIERASFHSSGFGEGSISVQINGVKLSDADRQYVKQGGGDIVDDSRVYVVCNGSFSSGNKEFFLDCGVRDRNGIGFELPSLKDRVEKLRDDLVGLFSPTFNVISALDWITKSLKGHFFW
jgi:hypothetical protein